MLWLSLRFSVPWKAVHTERIWFHGGRRHPEPHCLAFPSCQSVHGNAFPEDKHFKFTVSAPFTQLILVCEIFLFPQQAPQL